MKGLVKGRTRSKLECIDTLTNQKDFGVCLDREKFTFSKLRTDNKSLIPSWRNCIKYSGRDRFPQVNHSVNERGVFKSLLKNSVYVVVLLCFTLVSKRRVQGTESFIYDSDFGSLTRPNGETGEGRGMGLLGQIYKELVWERGGKGIWVDERLSDAKSVSRGFDVRLVLTGINEGQIGRNAYLRLKKLNERFWS